MPGPEKCRNCIYGGIHFGFDKTATLESGRNLGQYVVENYLKPR